MKVARYNYPAQFGSDPKPLLEEISEMILQGRYVLTEEVSAFERAFARYLEPSPDLSKKGGTQAAAVTAAVAARLPHGRRR